MADIEVINPVENEEAQGAAEQDVVEQNAVTDGEGQAEEASEKDAELVVSFGEDQDAEDEHKEAAPWVKNLRKEYKESQKEIRALRERLKEVEGAPQQMKMPDKPTLEGCDWDSEAFASKMEEWYAAKQKFDAQEQEAKRQAEEQQAIVAKRVETYEEKKRELKAPDYADAEDDVANALSVTQRGILIGAAENPALLIYALGKNPKRLAELAKISDPVQFTWAAAKLESMMKTESKKPPQPERVVKGSATLSDGTGRDAKLEQLRAEAERTGDHTKVVAYRRQMKALKS